MDEAGRIVSFAELRVTIVNTATIGSDQTPTQTDTVDVPIVSVVDPRITKQMDPARAQVGYEITIVLIVRNYGNANATNVVVSDQLPPELDLLSASATRGSVNAVYGAGGVFTVTISALGPGEDSIITARARVNANANPLPITIINAALLDYEEGDPVSSNTTTVDVPKEDSDGGDDDDDDDDRDPPSTPTPPLPIITPTPAVHYLPETGVGRPSGGAGVPGVIVLVTLLALAVTLVKWR
jgi:uncharacterized repeat protein (TIGR01451 family)